MTEPAYLMIAASEHDADMLYASGMFVPDPFVAIGIGGTWHGLLSPLEVEVAACGCAGLACPIATPERLVRSPTGL